MFWPSVPVNGKAIGCGFEAGFDQGCKRGIGVSDEEALKIHEEASEAAVWLVST